MRADYRVVLDACVLIPMPLADTLLRMAEAPRLYPPKWSHMIMDEVTRNLTQNGICPSRRRAAGSGRSGGTFPKRRSKDLKH
jgi:hypothetical protein